MTYTTRPLISAIVAMSQNRVIGQNNRLPWHLPADLKHFKEVTLGHPIIMGRKTYESIGKPLPNRTNIILSRDSHFQAPGCIVVTSIQEALKHTSVASTDELFIIGGAQIYKLLLNDIKRIYLTIVHEEFRGDTYFPELSEKDWRETEKKTFPADNVNSYAYSFIILDRATK